MAYRTLIPHYFLHAGFGKHADATMPHENVTKYYHWKFHIMKIWSLWTLATEKKKIKNVDSFLEFMKLSKFSFYD